MPDKLPPTSKRLVEILRQTDSADIELLQPIATSLLSSLQGRALTDPMLKRLKVMCKVGNVVELRRICDTERRIRRETYEKRQREEVERARVLERAGGNRVVDSTTGMLGGTSLSEAVPAAEPVARQDPLRSVASSAPKVSANPPRSANEPLVSSSSAPLAPSTVLPGVPLDLSRTPRPVAQSAVPSSSSGVAPIPAPPRGRKRSHDELESPRGSVEQSYEPMEWDWKCCDCGWWNQRIHVNCWGGGKEATLCKTKRDDPDKKHAYKKGGDGVGWLANSAKNRGDWKCRLCKFWTRGAKCPKCRGLQEVVMVAKENDRKKRPHPSTMYQAKAPSKRPVSLGTPRPSKPTSGNSDTRRADDAVHSRRRARRGITKEDRRRNAMPNNVNDRWGYSAKELGEA